MIEPYIRRALFICQISAPDIIRRQAVRTPRCRRCCARQTPLRPFVVVLSSYCLLTGDAVSLAQVRCASRTVVWAYSRDTSLRAGTRVALCMLTEHSERAEPVWFHVRRARLVAPRSLWIAERDRPSGRKGYAQTTRSRPHLRRGRLLDMRRRRTPWRLNTREEVPC